MSNWVEHYKAAEGYLVRYHQTGDTVDVMIAQVHATLASTRISPNDERFNLESLQDSKLD